jgi:hypothetical protein
MVVNDHVLKRMHPGFISGKLSDFACLVLLPLFLHASCEVVCARFARGLSPKASNRVLAACVWLSVVVFASVELSPSCEHVYRVVCGALRWPLDALAALARGEVLPRLGLVRATADPGDLAALPMGLVAYAVARRPDPRRSTAVRAGVVAPLSLLLVGHAPSAHAEEKRSWRKHDGGYLAAEFGAGVGFVDSTASISNGFAQEIPSSARGFAMPVAALEFGASVPATGFVIGGRVGGVSLREPEIESAGQRFRIRDSVFPMFEGQAFVDYYPNPKGGFHAGFAFGVATLSRSGSEHGRTQVGWDLSLEAGHGFSCRRCSHRLPCTDAHLRKASYPRSAPCASRSSPTNISVRAPTTKESCESSPIRRPSSPSVSSSA